MNRMNGWQRLWFAGTILGLIIFGLIYPVLESARTRDYTYRWAIQKDYANPACEPFRTLPFEQLKEPAFSEGGTTCWHTYTTRQYEDGHRAFMTFEAWTAQDDSDRWGFVAGMGAICAIIVLLISGLVYGAGKTVGWIVKGFRNPA